ncbi:MAG: hypothetical protein WDM80_16915 [Limisphaerales bacterium]
MRGLFRLAIVLAVFWLFGCAVVLLIEISQLPTLHGSSSDKPSFEVFFKSMKVEAVYVRYKPGGDIIGFPPTMSRPEIEDALRKVQAKRFEAYEYGIGVGRTSG